MPWGALSASQTSLLLPGTKYNIGPGGVADGVFLPPRFSSVLPINGYVDRWNNPGTFNDQNSDLVGYYVDNRGFVQLSGHVNCTPVGATWANNNLVVINIPAPYRPPKTVGWIMANDLSLAILATVDVSGNLMFWCPSTASTPAKVTLDGCVYYCGSPGHTAVTAGNMRPDLRMDPLIGTPTLELPTYVSPFASALTGTNNIVPDQPSGQALWQGAYTVTAATTADVIALTNPIAVVSDPDATMTREIFPTPTLAAGSSTNVSAVRTDIDYGLSGNFYIARLRPEFAIAINQISYMNNVVYNMRGAGAGATPNVFGSQPSNANPFSTQFGWDDAFSTGWVDLALGAPWVNYGAPYRGAQAKRDAYGRVHLRGMIKDGAAADRIATLPAEMRSSLTTQHVVYTSQGLSTVQITLNTGVISVVNGRNYVGGTGQWFSLSGVKIMVN